MKSCKKCGGLQVEENDEIPIANEYNYEIIKGVKVPKIIIKYPKGLCLCDYTILIREEEMMTNDIF
jgi:hypothetical protein